MEISVVIPTKDREKDLLECIESITKQTVKPVEVLIIDDGQISIEVKENIKNSIFDVGIILKYLKKNKAGLAESKNLGAKESRGEIVLFLDDDVILENNYIDNLLKVWTWRWNEKKLAGVSGIITSIRKKSFLELIFNKIFCLYSAKPYSILAWGYQTDNFDSKGEDFADWLSGCSASFRKEIFDIYQFRSLQKGRTGAEDVEFCWQLKNDGYYFIITPFAKLIHKESAVARDKTFVVGFKEGQNRKIMFKMHAKKSIKNYIYFFIASFGCVLRQFLIGRYSRGFGMLKGYYQSIK